MTKIQINSFDDGVLRFTYRKRTGTGFVSDSGVLHDCEFDQPRGHRGHELLAHQRELLEVAVTNKDYLTPDEKWQLVLDDTMADILSGELELLEDEKQLLQTGK